MNESYFLQNYTRDWKNVFDHIPQTDGFALLYSTFYVLSLGGTRIIIDPCLRLPWMASAIGECLVSDFEKADAVLISHAHADHFCPNAISASETAEIPWYVPEKIDSAFCEKRGLHTERIAMRIRENSTFTIGHIRLTAYSMPHTDADGTHPMDELGYLMEYGEKRLFFPMDIRNYDPSLLPQMEKPDYVFMHVWLGRGKAEQLPCEPERTQFCSYIRSIGAKRVVLAHLNDVARKPNDRWTFTHCGLIADQLSDLCPETQLLVPSYGTWYKI